MNFDYLAGFIDGEGTLTFMRQTIRGRPNLLPVLIVTQKEPDILYAIQDFLGDGKAMPTKYRYELRGRKRLKPVLLELEPRLIIKREHCRVLLDFMGCRERSAHQSGYDEHCFNLDRQLAGLQQRRRERVIGWAARPNAS